MSLMRALYNVRSLDVLINKPSFAFSAPLSTLMNLFLLLCCVTSFCVWSLSFPNPPPPYFWFFGWWQDMSS